MILTQIPQRPEPFGDVVAVGLRQGTVVGADPLPDQLVSAALEHVDRFDPDASAGAVTVVPLPEQVGPNCLLLVGLGDGTPADLRIAAVALGRQIVSGSDTHPVTVALDAPDFERSRALAEGLVIGGYDFSLAAEPVETLHIVALIGQLDAAGLAAGDAAADAAGWARDLGNLPADRLTPLALGERATDQLVAAGCEVAVHGVDWLTETGFGGVLAVGAGSSAPPCFITASWKPRGARTHIVLVGKGITFDTGGLNLKPPDGMRMMHTDMCGAAAVLAALHFAAVSRLPIQVTALVPSAENAVSGTSMRPSDVITHFGGRTTEVGNTDAEGRLVLADALAYAVARLKPDVVIDVATLTGAMKVALGLETAGFFANDDSLAAGLEAAASSSGEAIWRMPLEHAHLGSLDSPVADARNDPGAPGAITAALFLQPFVGSVPWAHLDIAGPARAASPGPIFSRGATGFGARLLSAYLESAADSVAVRAGDKPVAVRAGGARTSKQERTAR